MVSNCRIWALRQKRNFGGYLNTRQSRRYYWWGRGWWDHYFWSPDGDAWYEFVPAAPHDSHWWPRLTGLPLPLFRGEVRQVPEAVARRLHVEWSLDSL